MRYDNLVIRADASSQIGTGHLMRCLALAQAWQDAGGGVFFVMGAVGPILKERLQSEGMETVHLTVHAGSADDAMKTANLAQEVGATWVVVDGYHFDTSYHRIIKDSGARLLVMDDNGQHDYYCADIVLNQNIHAKEDLYANREPYTRLLLETRYVLLRREFLQWQGWKRAIHEEARKILVTLGGGDPDNITLKIMKAIDTLSMKDLEIKIVIGPSNPHMDSLREAVRRSRFAVNLLPSVKEMPEVMAWADVAISAGGSTCWELSFMGLPSILLVLAENQSLIAERLQAEGVALNLSCHQALSHAEIGEAIKPLLMTSGMRKRMAQCGPTLVDGAGAGRVLARMDNRDIRFRRVYEKDGRLLWEWANETDVRSGSFSSGAIPWEQHVRWLKSKLNDPNCIAYIISNENGDPIGQVRYDLNGKEAVISISIDRKFRGQGYGSLAVLLSSQKIFDTSEVQTIHAYAKQSNESSARAFLKAGFRNTGTRMISGNKAFDFVLKKDFLV